VIIVARLRFETTDGNRSMQRRAGMGAEGLLPEEMASGQFFLCSISTYIELIPVKKPALPRVLGGREH
jgi:hypothetical protein